MRKLSCFNFITLNGFYAGLNGDISWHNHGDEGVAHSEESLKSGNMLLFGRVTYQLMVNFWTTEMARQTLPIVAEGMNSAEKIVFSRTLNKVEWNNSSLIKDNMVEEIKRLKESPGKDMTILGSGSIVTQFAEHGLIDIYELMVDPMALGDGSQLFKGLSHPLNLKLASSRVFKSGTLLLRYEALK
jgi:dihydrofolate reductase